MIGRDDVPGDRLQGQQRGTRSRGRVRQARGATSGRARAGLVLTALAAVLLLDWLQGSRAWPTVMVGLLDEPAHLLTTWLVLAAVAQRADLRLWGWALAGSVVIDLDHLPFYLHWQPIISPVGRPVTHSLALVGVLLVLCAIAPLRKPAFGLAVGVLLHLARDLATGPGVPLLWPMSPDGWTVPYPVYAAGLAIAALVTTVPRNGPPSTATIPPASSGQTPTTYPTPASDG